MKVKILRFQVDATSNEKKILEEAELTTDITELTAKDARRLLRENLPDWTAEWPDNDGWPYLYKYRDERGRIFKAQKSTGKPLVKGSFHPVSEYVEIWSGNGSPKPKATKKRASNFRPKKIKGLDNLSDDNPENQ